MVALPYIAMGLATAATAVSTAGALSQADFQGKLAERGAMLARRNAVDASARGAAEAGKRTMEGSAAIGEARAQTGASGVDVVSPNVLDTLGQNRLITSLDSETIRNNALREALGFEVQAQSAELQGSAASLAGTYGAMGSILGGAGSVMNVGYSSGLFPKFGGGGADKRTT
jgi:hypothetical protein